MNGKHPLYNGENGTQKFHLGQNNSFNISSENQGRIERFGLDFDQSALFLGSVEHVN